MKMTPERLQEMMAESAKSAVSIAMKESFEPQIKGLSDRITGLEGHVPDQIHTKGHVHDDGHIQERGHDLYELPGGSVINAGNLFKPIGKGGGLFRRSTGIFERLGPETEEFFVKMKEHLQDHDVFKVTTKALDIANVMTSMTDQSGGLFVPDDIRYSLLQFAPPGTIVWPRAQVWPMTTQSIQWPKLKQSLVAGSEEFFGNVIMTWTEEGQEKTDTMAEFGQLGLTAHELSAYTEITDILIADSAINIGNLLTQLFQGTYWHFTDRAFLRGMGNIQPLGILNDPKVRTVKRYEEDLFRYEDAVNMSSDLPPMFDAGAVWMMKKATFNSLRKQKDNDGHPVIQLGQGYNDFGEGIAGYMLGYPIVMADYKVNSMGERGDVILGDWKHYFIGERSGVDMSMSRHAAYRHNRTAFRATARLGGIPEEPNAFVILSDEVSDEAATS